MPIPVPPAPNSPMTGPDGQPSPEWDKYFNTIQAVLNNTGGTILQPNAGGTGQSSYVNGELLIGNTTGNTLESNTLTPGTNIAIANGAGTITIGLTGSISQPNGGTGFTSYTDGQLLIGKTSDGSLAKSTLTAGTGVSITNGSGTITISQSATSAVITQVTKQIFTSSGTYTPTTGMKYCIVEAVGGGGGGTGTSSTSALTNKYSTGGGAGGYCRSYFSAATIGSSQTVTIGAGGAGGTGAANAAVAGSNGGATSLGSLLVTSAGLGGPATQLNETTGGASSEYVLGVADTGSVTGDFSIPGGTSETTTATTDGASVNVLLGGGGGIAPVFGSRQDTSIYRAVSGSGAGIAAPNYGCGGGGSSAHNNNKTGGAGSKGVMVITEYLSI